MKDINRTYLELTRRMNDAETKKVKVRGEKGSAYKDELIKAIEEMKASNKNILVISDRWGMRLVKKSSELLMNLIDDSMSENIEFNYSGGYENVNFAWLSPMHIKDASGIHFSFDTDFVYILEVEDELLDEVLEG